VPKPDSPPAKGQATPGQWAALTALSAAAALWSVFLWAELVVSRAGGGSFCGFGGRLDCTEVWNGALATMVHRRTGVPIAGWGLAWSAVVFILALLGLARFASGSRPGAAHGTAVRLAAAGGFVAILVLLGSSLSAGAICVGCVGTYLLVGGIAAIALFLWRGEHWPDPVRGGGIALGTFLAAFVLLLYPGLRTPRTSGEAGRNAVASAATASAELPAVGTALDPSRDRKLAEMIAALDPAGRQTLADSLAIYRASKPVALPPPRALVGSPQAPVRITEFTDILCEHCAGLHETLKTLREYAPPGSFSVDARQFPLDGRCNPRFTSGKGDDVRCVAAAARICAEAAGREPDLAGALFARQAGLTRDAVMAVASAYQSPEALAACIASPATMATLQGDLEAAAPFDSDGTPIVAVNGRRGTSYGPFLYAMILTQGDPEHPAFDVLPAGNPAAHLH
jgi:serine/threonine-protein kinase